MVTTDGWKDRTGTTCHRPSFVLSVQGGVLRGRKGSQYSLCFVEGSVGFMGITVRTRAHRQTKGFVDTSLSVVDLFHAFQAPSLTRPKVWESVWALHASAAFTMLEAVVFGLSHPGRPLGVHCATQVLNNQNPTPLSSLLPIWRF